MSQSQVRWRIAPMRSRARRSGSSFGPHRFGSSRLVALPEPVTVRNIRETNAARNLDVIQVLRRLGLAEDAGRGIDVVQDTMRFRDASAAAVHRSRTCRRGRAPGSNALVRRLLQTDAHGARTVLHRLRDRALLVQHGHRGGATYTLSGSLAPPAGRRLSSGELEDLIVGLAGERAISNPDVREATGPDRVVSLAYLERLTNAGRRVRRGQRRGTRYERR